MNHLSAFAPAIVGTIAVLVSVISALWIAKRPPATVTARRKAQETEAPTAP